MALYQPQGGFLTPERCIVAYANAAMALGAEIHGREKVLSYEPTAPAACACAPTAMNTKPTRW